MNKGDRGKKSEEGQFRLCGQRGAIEQINGNLNSPSIDTSSLQSRGTIQNKCKLLSTDVIQESLSKSIWWLQGVIYFLSIERIS